MNITPSMLVLADTIASGLIGDLKAKRIPKCGIEEVEAAIDAREQTKIMSSFKREQLIAMTLRKLVQKVG